jgi:DNA transformation protein and related proteins
MQGGLDPKRLKEIFAQVVGPDVPFTARPMFGGFGCYIEGRIFATLLAAGAALKLPDGDFAALCAAGGAPMCYRPDRAPSKHYVRVPDSMLDDAAALAHWTQRAVQAARAAEPPARRSKTGRRRG